MGEGLGKNNIPWRKARWDEVFDNSDNETSRSDEWHLRGTTDVGIRYPDSFKERGGWLFVPNVAVNYSCTYMYVILPCPTFIYIDYNDHS